jgi:hypothetical protein
MKKNLHVQKMNLYSQFLRLHTERLEGEGGGGAPVCGFSSIYQYTVFLRALVVTDHSLHLAYLETVQNSGG